MSKYPQKVSNKRRFSKAFRKRIRKQKAEVREFKFLTNPERYK